SSWWRARPRGASPATSPPASRQKCRQRTNFDRAEGSLLAPARGMDARIFIAAIAASLGALAAPSNRSCLVCHTQQFFDADAFARSVHGKLDCAECHKGYDFSMHRAKPPEWSKQEAQLIERIGPRSTAPAAFAACGSCHES